MFLSIKWGPLAPTFEVGLEDALEVGAVVVAPQTQLLVHVALAQVERSTGVYRCGARAILVVKEPGIGVLPLVYLPCGRGWQRV